MDVYLVGTPYSGSTLLGNALNGHEQIFHAGELSRLPAFGLGPPATECTVCRVLERRCPVWDAEIVERIEARGPASALAEVRRASGTATLVDSSKHVEWLRRVAAPNGLAPRARVLLTLRHPFAFAASVARVDGAPPWFAGNTWRDTVYDALRELGQRSIPFMIVRYEEFAADPEPVLRRVCDFLALDFDARCLSFWTTDVHALGGNPHAYVWYDRFPEKVAFDTEFAADRSIARDFRERRFGGWVDERWRRELTPEAMRQISMTPLLPDLAHLTGYELG